MDDGKADRDAPCDREREVAGCIAGGVTSAAGGLGVAVAVAVAVTG